MVQQLKRSYPLHEITAASDMYRGIAARLDAIVAAATEAELQTVDLKLGTLTGSMFQRMLDSMDKVEADARTSIRKQTQS